MFYLLSNPIRLCVWDSPCFLLVLWESGQWCVARSRSGLLSHDKPMFLLKTVALSSLMQAPNVRSLTVDAGDGLCLYILPFWVSFVECLLCAPKGRLYSWMLWCRVVQSLWSVKWFLLEFITRVLFMSFVSYFMLFQAVNMPQVISPSLLLLNLIYFLWNARRHILMFWGPVTCVCPSGIRLLWLWELSWKRAPNQRSRPGQCHPFVPSSQRGLDETAWWINCASLMLGWTFI